MPPSNRAILFHVTEQASSQRTASTATLAWLASELGLEFDAFVNPRSNPFMLAYLEQFNFLAAYYRDMYFCSLTRGKRVRFLRSAKAFGKTIVSTRLDAQIYDFYREVFSFFDIEMPRLAVVVGVSPQKTSRAKIKGVDAYCYPEIYFRKAIGLASDTPGSQLIEMLKDGVKDVYTVYCTPAEQSRLAGLGFNVHVVDAVKPDDTYGSITTRIADRWIDKAKAIAFGHPDVISFWAPRFLQESRLALWEDTDWVNFAETVARYAKAVENPVLFGSQAGLNVKISMCRDDWDVEIAKYDLTIILSSRSGQLPNRHLARLPADWLADAEPPWSSELSDTELEERAEAKGIAVCFLSYCADFGHIKALPDIYRLVASTGVRLGISFPATWYEYWSEYLEEMFLPPEEGGLYPLIEPLCSSTGEGVSTEAEGFNSAEFLEERLREARRKIGEIVGEKLVPIGYYPSKDACPYYLHGRGRPQFEAVKRAGFEYYITYMGDAYWYYQIPKIVYEDGNFIAVNQQVRHWTATPMHDLIMWERRLTSWNLPGWVIISIDVIPPPYGIDFIAQELWKAITYAGTGGRSGRLFLVKPHEALRYAKILKKKGIIPYKIEAPHSQ